jgi:hypothetical protein
MVGVRRRRMQDEYQHFSSWLGHAVFETHYNLVVPMVDGIKSLA